MSTTKFCPHCKTDRPLDEWNRNPARGDGLGGHCRACHNEVTRMAKQRKRSELLAEMGGVCVRCGYGDARALQIDHVDGGGRKENLATHTAAFYRKVRENAEAFQLLCANCNVIKRIENGEHRDASTYARNAPTERRVTSHALSWTPERHEQQSEAMKAMYAARTPEREAERRAKISATKRATHAAKQAAPTGTFTI